MNSTSRRYTRRDFLHKSAITAAAAGSLAVGGRLATSGAVTPRAEAAGTPPWRILNAYYFRGQMYTSVPAQVRADMQWMADHGTTAVTIGVLEQDLDSATQNIDRICTEAHRAGMKVFATPSRWGNIVAGSLKVPSIFTNKHSDSWILSSSGKPTNTGFGFASSVHYQEVVDFFTSNLQQLLTQWPIEGIIWDEPKTLETQDYSANAVAQKPPGSSDDWYTDTVCDFFDDVSGYAKSINPDVVVSLFIYSTYSDSDQNPYVMQRCAQIKNIDYFGCDGRPWHVSDDLGPLGDGNNPYTKVLLPNAQQFIAAAQQNGKGGVVLMENFSFDPPEPYYIDLMTRTIPQVITLKPEHLIYYYYGRSITDPDAVMKVTATALDNARRGK